MIAPALLQTTDLAADRPAHRLSKAVSSWAVFGAALIGMVGVYHGLWTDPAHRTLGRGHVNDPLQMMWFLKWVPWRVIHGHNPFTTTALFYPHGVSLTWNTSVPTLGLLAAPLTLTAGPASSFAVLLTLGPALTTLTGFWWLRRHTTRYAPAALGGFVIGFSPFIAGHLLGHLNLAFAALIPIALMLLEDLLWRHPRPAGRTAIYLGLVSAAQMGISEELLLIAIVAVLVAVAVACWVWPRATWTAAREAWPGLALAAAVFLLAASPLLVSQLFLSDPVTVDTSHFRAIVADYLYSMGSQLIHPAHLHHNYLGRAEDGVYLGWPVLAVVLVGTAVTVTRDRRIRLAALALLIMVSFTFGTDGLPHVWLPWRALDRVPYLQSVMPARFAFASSCVLGWLVAIWADGLLAAARPPHSASPGHRRLAPLVALAAMVTALITFVPRDVATIRLPADTPFFNSSQARALLPPNTAVLLLPMPSSGDASGMYYQQQADFRFAQPGGYALLPPGSPAMSGPGHTLMKLGIEAHLPSAPGPSPAALDAGRTAICQMGLTAILVVQTAPEAARLMTLATGLAGRPADQTIGGVAVWLLPRGSSC